MSSFWVLFLQCWCADVCLTLSPLSAAGSHGIQGAVRDALLWREERRGGEGRQGGEEERGDGEQRQLVAVRENDCVQISPEKVHITWLTTEVHGQISWRWLWDTHKNGVDK